MQEQRCVIVDTDEEECLDSFLCYCDWIHLCGLGCVFRSSSRSLHVNCVDGTERLSVCTLSSSWKSLSRTYSAALYKPQILCFESVWAHKHCCCSFFSLCLSLIDHLLNPSLKQQLSNHSLQYTAQQACQALLCFTFKAVCTGL